MESKCAADHNDHGGLGGKLAQWNAAANRAIDVQILISDSNFVQANSAIARHGGYVVHCDISGAAIGIAVYPGGGPYNAANAVAPTGISGVQVNGASLVCYGLAL